MLTRHKGFSISVTPGFLLLAALLFYADEGIGMLPWVILSAVAHEGGHIAASLLLGGMCRELSLSIAGAELRFFHHTPLTYFQENIVALAGPAVNLMAGGGLLLCKSFLPGIMSLGIGMFNLMPVRPLDGGRILYNLISEHFGPDRAELVLTIFAGAFIGLLAGFGAVSAVEYANFTILAGAAWLLSGTVKVCSKKYLKK